MVFLCHFLGSEVKMLRHILDVEDEMYKTQDPTIAIEFLKEIASRKLLPKDFLSVLCVGIESGILYRQAFLRDVPHVDVEVPRAILREVIQREPC